MSGRGSALEGLRGRGIDAALAGLFWRFSVEEVLECGRCGRSSAYPLLVGLDWRDLAALQLVRSQFPTVACTICGHPIANPSAIVESRPGDPMRVLVALPTAAAPSADHLEAALSHLAEPDGRITGSLTAVPAALALFLFDRYTGFDLSPGMGDTPHGGGDDYASWLAQVRSEIDCDAAATLTAYVNSADPDVAAALLLDRSDVLDDCWGPVRKRVYRAMRAAVEDAALPTLESRLSRLEQIILFDGDPPEDQSALPSDVRGAIDRAVAIDPQDESGERRAQLLAALAALRKHPHELLLIGTLGSTVATLTSLPTRTQDDVTLALELADELVERVSAALGADHRIVRLARNDRAVAMLERPGAQPNDDTAIDELTQLIAECLEHKDPLVVDAVLNLAVALGEAIRTPTADEQDDVVRLLRLGRHLLSLLQPEAWASEARLLNNLAAALRRAPLGARQENQEEAAAAYAAARDLDDQHHLFAESARFQLEANLLNAEAEAWLAELSPERVGRLRDAMAKMHDQAMSQFAHDHETRLSTVSNLATIAVDAYDASNTAGFPDPTLLDLACGWIDAATATTAVPRELAWIMANTRATANARVLPEGRLRDAEQARRGYEEILAATERERDAGLRRATAGNLGQLHLGQGSWAAAADAYATAVDAATLMIDRATTLRGRLVEIEAASDSSLVQALCLLQIGEVGAAVEAIEGVRRRLLGTEEAAEDLEPLFGSGGSLVVWMFTCRLGSALIASRRGQTGAVTIDALNSHQIGPAITALVSSQSQSEVANGLAKLAELLRPLLEPLHDLVEHDVPEEILIIAAGSLSRVPLHAISPAGRMPLLAAAPVRFLPSARAAARLRSRPPRRGQTLVVTNPAADLFGTEVEAAAVRRFDPASLSPPAGESIRAYLLDRLPSASHLHIACHTAVAHDPLHTEFLLGDPRTLSLADLLDLQLPNLESVIAAGCRTAVPFGSAPDELLGLGYGLLAAGAAEVVSSLWDIDDTVTALVIARLYELWEHQPLAVALAQAQRWCASLTNRELAQLAGTPPEWLSGRLGVELQAQQAHPRYRDPDAQPFRDPAYWGGLIYVGR